MKAIVRPNICTSLQCSPPKRHCRDCSHAIYTGRAEIHGRVYRWEHSPRFGPLFTRRKDGECDWTPGARHPVWQAFQEWHDRKFGKANKLVSDNFWFSDSYFSVAVYSHAGYELDTLIRIRYALEDHIKKELKRIREYEAIMCGSSVRPRCGDTEINGV